MRSRTAQNKKDGTFHLLTRNVRPDCTEYKNGNVSSCPMKLDKMKDNTRGKDQRLGYNEKKGIALSHVRRRFELLDSSSRVTLAQTGI